MQVDEIVGEPPTICPNCAGEQAESVLNAQLVPVAGPVAVAEPVAVAVDQRSCPLCGASNPVNADQCQACGEPIAAGREPTEIEPTSVDVFRVFQDAWYIYVSRFGIAFGGELLGTLLSFAVLVVWGTMLRDVPLMQSFCMLLHMLWCIFMSLGQSRLAVRICRDQSPGIGDLFVDGGGLFPALIGLLGAYFVGYLLLTVLVVPAAVWLRGSPASMFYLLGVIYAGIAVLSPFFMIFPMALYFVLVDQERGWLSTYVFAVKMVWRNFWKSYIAMLFVILVSAAGLLTCGVLLLFAIPYLWILAAVAYLHASNQIAATDSVFLGRRISDGA